jgi:hypothetical protein
MLLEVGLFLVGRSDDDDGDDVRRRRRRMWRVVQA